MSDRKEKIDYDKLMNMDYTYPIPADPDFQEKIYTKREFYYHKIPGREELKNYSDIRDYRDSICSRKFELQEHQSFLSNFINPDTPYKGVLIFHGTGTGKCLTGDQRVFLDGSLVPIEDIWKKYASNLRVPDEEDPNGEWALPIENIFVNSMNKDTNENANDLISLENMKLLRQKVKHLYRQKINEKINIVRLENGSTLKITKRHKLYTENGWTNNFSKSKYILIPKRLLTKDGVIENCFSIGEGKNRRINKSFFAKTKEHEFEFVRISSIVEIDYAGFVYDLEIENYHNFVAEHTLVSNTCAAIAIAEKFKEMIQKYNTKIYVLVSGPLIKENWKNELLKCTGETYLKQQDQTILVGEAEKNKAKKNAINIAMQYYRFMSYRSFYKKVLGEKLREKVKTKDNKIKLSYRKTKEGDFERDVAIDRIYNLNNSVIIIDEAHNLTDNSYGQALLKIIKNSHNLKVILLTATPMKNLADNIVELINFIRPVNFPLERDKIFNSHKNHLMDFKPTGLEYFKKMCRGYVSYLRGADPLTFARRVEKGERIKELLFTKVVRCKMHPFQQSVYDEAIKIQDDTLDRRSEAVANFSFPGLSQDRTKLVGFYGREGINILKNQLKTHHDTINKKISTEILKNESLDTETDLLYIADNNKTITGGILKFNNLKYFSIKFYKALKKLNRLVWGKKGARTAFVYSNLVKVGIELFQEILLQNGYLEYEDNYSNYKITNTTICYFCGKTFRDHQTQKLKLSTQISRIKNGSESSTDYELKTGEPPYHDFHPAAFIPITGKTSEEAVDIIPEDKKQILDNIFSGINNKEGKYIKLVLGSKVMSEAISLKNVAEVHILDVYFNLGKVDQVIGRAIRHCSHYEITNDQNRYPQVNVYKYAVTIDKGLSSEEELYRKAEQKYLLIKKTERALKEVAIDCPLNRNGNIFPEELTKYKDCVEPKEPNPDNKPLCPGVCDYTKCSFLCESKKLNEDFYDKSTNRYRNVSKDQLDNTTFTQNLAKNEIDIAKGKIKEMYRIKYVFTLKEIISYVKNSYHGEKKELFEDFFVFKALDELIPITENDFNNFKDTIFDKFNRPGYLIYIDKYYIFQPFDQNEDVPMYYRSTYDKPMKHTLTLRNYIKNTEKFKLLKDKSVSKKASKVLTPTVEIYDFESVMEYYDNRDEFTYVGIIDKESARRKIKSIDELNDVFKIRERRDKILEKKRGTGIPSITGAVCYSSKSKEYLEDIAKSINIKLKGNETRTIICDQIKKKLLFLEKYSTAEKKNKLTYVMIPKNHPEYKFPYNLEDRAEYIKGKIDEKIKFGIDIKINKIKRKVDGENVTIYNIKIKQDKNLADFDKFFESLGLKLVKGFFELNID